MPEPPEVFFQIKHNLPPPRCHYECNAVFVCWGPQCPGLETYLRISGLGKIPDDQEKNPGKEF